MINREGKLNLSTSGGSDLNQELVGNSEYTKATSEKETDGIESSGMNSGENMLTGGGSSTPNKTSMMGENDEEDYDKEDQEDGNSIGNYSNDDSYKVSDMNSRMNHERDAEKEVNDEPSMRENTLTKSDVPYDVPDDQTPHMSDMPKNVENMTKKGDNSEPASE